MSRDPFEIGKIDQKKALQGPSQGSQIGQQANLARAGESAGAAGAGAPAQVAPTAAVPPSDQVQLSSPDDNDSARGAAVSNNIVAAWGGQQNQPVTDTANTGQVNGVGGASSGFNISQGPPSGFSGGGVFGAGGVSGQEPGMHAGGVYTPNRLQAA